MTIYQNKQFTFSKERENFVYNLWPWFQKLLVILNSSKSTGSIINHISCIQTHKLEEQIQHALQGNVGNHRRLRRFLRFLSTNYYINFDLAKATKWRFLIDFNYLFTNKNIWNLQPDCFMERPWNAYRRRAIWRGYSHN